MRITPGKVGPLALIAILLLFETLSDGHQYLATESAVETTRILA
jgi:hypothetical protein